MTLAPRGLLVLVLLTCAACPAEDGFEYGVDTPASAQAPRAVCPANAPTLGTAGVTAVERVDLAWTGNGSESYVEDYLYFVIPDDILSLLVAVEHRAEYTAINVMGVDGERWLDLPNAIGEAPFYHWPVEVAAVTMPINTQTIPQGGCLALDPVVYADVAGETGTLHLVTRRGPSQPSQLDVNVFVVGSTDVTDDEIEAAIDRMSAIYAQGGAAMIGEVSVSTLSWPSPYVDAEGAEPAELRAQTSGNPAAVNLLLIQDFNEVGTLGIAAGIPGPNGVMGTAGSGVMVSVDTHLDGDGTTLLTDMMGETIAHEIGHQLGLFHTSESDGLTHDPITDTAECDASRDADRDEELSAEECESVGGRNFMFWTAAEVFGQTEVSPTQAMVLRDSVIARPQ